jgi:hypothetical protein
MSGSSTSSSQGYTSNSNFYPSWTQSGGEALYNSLVSPGASAGVGHGTYPSWTPYSGPTSAPFGPGTQTATNYATQNVGQPNQQQAASGQTLQSIINMLGNPGAGPTQYMNPYVQQTLNPTLQNLQIANQQQNQATGAAATLSGAYGGTGQGVQTALNNYFGGQNVANASGQAYSNAYNSAINQQQTALNQLLGAAGGQTSLGGSIAGTGTSLASLLAGIGGQQQQAGQTGIQNAINLNQQNQTMPLSEAATLASIMSGVPLNTFSEGTSTQQTTQPNNTGLSLLGSGLGLLGGLSDVRAKTNISRIGKLLDGQNVYSFRYKGDPTSRIGLMAQEVEKTRPDAVSKLPDILGGLKVVDYAKATEKSRLIDMIGRIAA